MSDTHHELVVEPAATVSAQAGFQHASIAPDPSAPATGEIVEAPVPDPTEADA